MAQRDAVGLGEETRARWALRAAARVITAEAPDEIRAALRALSVQGVAPPRGLVRYARRRLDWLEHQRAHQRRPTYRP